jgi:hypothetical protein
MERADDDLARSLVRECRREVDDELSEIHDRITKNMWTPERAEKLAEDVLARAIPAIEDRLMMNLKISVGDATLAVLRETSSKVSLASGGCSASLSLSLLSKANEATEAEATEGGSAAPGATALSAASLAALSVGC